MLRRKQTLALAALIVAPAAVLSILAARALRQEQAERRTDLERLATVSLEAVRRDLEATLSARRDEAWRSLGPDPAAAGRGGALVCVRGIYPRAAESGPTLEERLRRESPDLLLPLSEAVDLEFAKKRPAEASTRYAEISSQVESPATRAALLHAQARARRSRELYERLEREFGDLAGESGLSYGLIARVRLAELGVGDADGLLRAMAAAGLPGHSRAMILSELGRPASDARALERLEEILDHGESRRDDVLRIDRRLYLISFRAEAGLAIPLEPPRLTDQDGLAFEMEGIDEPRGELLRREPSALFPSLAIAVRLVDPARVATPRTRLWITGGLVACLVAALAVGIFAMFRAVGRELAVARIKSDFVSGVSHDLKTPLTSIRMFSEMLEAGKAADPREYHRLIHRESVRLSRMVENVLDFARIEEGKKTFAFAERSLNEIVSTAVDVFRAQGHDVRVSMPPERLVASVDADAIVGAVLNLLENGVKYAQGLELSLARRDGCAEIGVKDEGPGIPPEERSRIFEKFFRGTSAAAGPAGGAGLGLALVKHTAEAHGGSVTVESEVGKGSRFTLSLPLCRESSS